MYIIFVFFSFISFPIKINHTEGFAEEKICGRPLGLAFDTQGNNLIVADAYYGIWLVNLSNGKKTQLVTPTEELDGTVNKYIK